MQLARKYPSPWSYLVVVLIVSVLAVLYWKAVRVLVSELDRRTHSVESSEVTVPKPPYPAKHALATTHTKPIPAPETEQAQHPIPRLQELFENGWPDLPGYYNIDTLTAEGPPPTYTLHIPWRLNGDFAVRSKFLEVFFASNVRPAEMFDACTYIANNYQQFIDLLDSLVDIRGQWPGDTSVTHFRDMVFSKRIFIYYDNPDFSLEQKASLEVLYKAKDLSVQFRGTEYAVMHRDDHPPFRPKPLVPNSILLPRGRGGLIVTFTNLKEGQKMIIPLGPQ